MTASLSRSFAGLVLGLNVVVFVQHARADDLVENAKARAAAADEAYRLAWLRLAENVEPASSANLEMLHLWSRRLMEAQQEVSNKKEDKLAAAQTHLERMKQLEDRVKKLVDAGDARALDSAGAKYYRLEAERQVLLAKAR
jgi:hypothetical protein